jgi:hypothetical protein
VTPKQAKLAKSLRAEIATLTDRRALTEDCRVAEQDSVDALIAQGATWELIEEHRNKATFYYESVLDLTILVGRLARKLADLAKPDEPA